MNHDASKVAPSEQVHEYEAPEVKVMSEEEVLSVFQVTAAGTTAWWTK